MGKVVLKIAFCIAALSAAEQSLAQLDRSKPPAPGLPHKIEIAKSQSFVLPNGLQVLLVEDHRAPKVWFSVRLLHDLFVEGDKAGSADIMGSLMRYRTRKRSEDKLNRELGNIGASLDISSDGVSASGLTRYLDTLLDLMTDVLYHTAFRKKDFEWVKKQALFALQDESQNPLEVANKTISRLVYGKDHPYGELITQQTLGHIALSDCKAYYDTYFRPHNAYLIVVGDITLERLKPLAKRWFGSWERGGAIPQPVYAVPAAPVGARVALVDFSNAAQSVVRIAYPIDLKIGSPNAAQVEVLARILGGNASARLFRSLREDKGYTYGAYFNVIAADFGGMGYTTFSTRNETTGAAVLEALAQMRRMRAERVSAQELSDAKESLIGEFVRLLEDPSIAADFAFSITRYGLPADFYSSYPERIQQVSIDDVLSAAQRYVLPDSAYVQVVGKYLDVVDQLKALGPVSCYDMGFEPVSCPDG